MPTYSELLPTWYREESLGPCSLGERQVENKEKPTDRIMSWKATGCSSRNWGGVELLGGRGGAAGRAGRQDSPLGGGGPELRVETGRAGEGASGQEGEIANAAALT